MNDKIKEMVLVMDFGGQYSQLIARRIRECGVYCEIHPFTISIDKIRALQPKGIVFSGGPSSVYGEGRQNVGKKFFTLGIPVRSMLWYAINYLRTRW